jgi:hypothetical protein
MKFLQTNRVKAFEIINDTISYFSKKYRLAGLVFSYATAYGQIILAVSDLVQVFFVYLQDVAVENNVLQAKRISSIYAHARVKGHDPMRGSSAVGSISLALKPTYPSVTMDTIYFYNYMKVKCNDNGLIYLLDLGIDLLSISLKSAIPNMRIIEGSFEVQTFTGTGEDLQSFNVAVPVGRFIEKDRIYVTANGVKYSGVSSLYEFSYGRPCFVTKTGIRNGVDIYFGRNYNAVVPKFGEQIRVDYLITNGAVGNFSEFETATFTFMDTGYDPLGNEIDLNQFFNISIDQSPQFGADPEGIELTRKLIPLSGQNTLLHDRKTIEYYFTKMNLYSYVHVRNEYNEDTGQFVVTLIPDIFQKVTTETDYFNIALDRFLLSDNHINRLLNRIEASGEKTLYTSIDIENADIKRYVLHLIIYCHRNAGSYIINDMNVRKDVKSKLNDYLIKSVRTRHNVIPHSDIVRIIDEIAYVDSVKAVFISEENEAADAKTIGFDDIGNIFTEPESLPLLRGGWSDRNGVYYDDDFDVTSEKMQTINVMIKYI